MTQIPLRCHGGGRLLVHGSLAAERIIVVLSRDSFLLDDALVDRLVRFFTGHNLTVVRYESRVAETTRLIDHPVSRRWPAPLRQAMKALRLLRFPGRWRHFSGRYREEQNAIPYRVQSLRELIRFFGPDKELIFLTRSAGGRVASLVADETGIARLVCLGYPFRHPDKEPEPERYLHLAHLQTPFLILQGVRDSYGGREVLETCRFAPPTQLEWVDTDHGFSLSEDEMRRILNLIHHFVINGGQSAPAAVADQSARVSR